MIQMVDLKRQYTLLKREIDQAIQDVLDKTSFIMGENVSSLEKEIAAYHGVSHAIGVGNGTDALLLALRGSGIGAGDEVITTPFTFIATAEVIGQVNATPVFVDIKPDTFNMDPEKIEGKITEKTKAIMPVHLFGHPADMDPIVKLAEKYNLIIIEDCAQAFGAEYRGKRVGTFGDYACFSFFPSKNLACYGDGGMVMTEDEARADTIRMLRNHGSRVRYYHSMLGYNSRLDEIQAAVVRVKLKRINEFNELRRKNADLYRENIRRDDLRLPSEEEDCRHVYHQFTIRSKMRDSLAHALKENGISSAIYYPVPLHRQEVFASLNFDASEFKESDGAASEVLSLPMFPELLEDEIYRVCDVINNVS
ncbi:MAG: DegT/DnrJ/EryC1/StrS family aminotransferase [Syntrophobacterales bacterium]|nr:MAG: DegT/DnrJ/EryC1/StrS family aminotransferase [Syntrophobacterales bacterium]